MSLVAQHVSMSYGAQPVLYDINLELSAGKVSALVGPNGSGKSTLIRCLAGLLSHEGTVTLAGKPRRSEYMGYMPQDTPASVALSVLETVLLGRVRRLRWQVGDGDLSEVYAVLQRLGIAHLAERWLCELSGGQRQLVFLAQALVAQPRVLLLDEPISALDLRHQLEVLETVCQVTHERRLVTLVVLHDLNAAARHCDNLLVLCDGRLKGQGAAADVLTRDCLSRVFEVETEQLFCSGGRTVLVPLRSARRQR
ncbi:MAG: ABC transporter ATP-binding protein [Hydrogenophaga sp.]|uniref:ABC transporter ATP-binding protein n=1 Tax=Hydrogenophaga sp. TaxID=1904254 RepID=UPI001A4BB951|nr:ABC transporter ATP-binding protein [Hydrogenophaga sp.]